MDSLLVLALFGVCVVWYIYRKFLCRLARLNLAGPDISPIFGDVFDFQQTNYQFHLLLDKYYKKYGKLFSFYHQGSPVISVADQKMISKILNNHFQNFCDRKFFIDLPEPCHEMITMLPGSKSSNVRTLLKSILQTSTIKKAMGYYHKAATTFEMKLEEDKGQQIDAVSFAQGYIMEILTKLVFSLDVPNQSDLNKTLVSLSQSICKPPYWINIIAALPFGRHLVKYIPSAYKNQLQPLIDIAVKLVTERRQEKDGKSKEDVLAALLSAQESNADLADSLLLAQGLIVLTAVQTLTSTTIAIALYHLAKYTEIQHHLQYEVDQLTQLTEESPNWEELQANLPHLDNFIKEVLRLYPSGYMLTRECVKSIKIDNIQFEKGDVVIIPTYSIHRDDSVYKDAETFDPNRYNDENANKLPHYSFGNGMRGCVGKQLAFAEIKVLMARLLKNYQISLCNEKQEIDIRSHFNVQAMMSIDQQINLKFTARCPKPATP